jgi:hypothetical protein
MGKTGLFAASALIVACIAGWAVSGTEAQVATRSAQIEPFKMMTSANQLPTEHFTDYSLVF